MGKCSTTKILGLALAGIGALAATNVMAASPVKVGGQIQTDFVTYSGDTDDNQANYSEYHSGADLRRVNFYLKGELDDVWSYQIQWNATDADGNSRLDDTWLGFAGFDPVWLAVGKVTVPYGAESFGGSSATTFTERASVDRFNPGDGVGLYGEGQMDMLSYSFAVVTPDYDTASGSSSDPVVWGARVTFAPVATDDNVYHFGGSYNYRKVDKNSTNANVWSAPTYNVRTTNNTLSSVGGVAGEVDNTSTWALEAAGVWGPLYVHAEYADHELEGRGAVKDASFDAWFVQASYMLTGESRPYDAASGTFGRVKPASNMGAWEVAVRYDNLDLSDNPTSYTASALAGELETTSLGVNWYANDNVKFQLSYVRGELDYTTRATTRDRDLNTLTLRAQVRF